MFICKTQSLYFFWCLCLSFVWLITNGSVSHTHTQDTITFFHVTHIHLRQHLVYGNLYSIHNKDEGDTNTSRTQESCSQWKHIINNKVVNNQMQSKVNKYYKVVKKEKFYNHNKYFLYWNIFDINPNCTNTLHDHRYNIAYNMVNYIRSNIYMETS